MTEDCRVEPDNDKEIEPDNDKEIEHGNDKQKILLSIANNSKADITCSFV